MENGLIVSHLSIAMNRIVLFSLIVVLLFSAPANALIVDHNAVKEFDNIPDEWIEKAKKLTIHYAHTSHGSQINTGLEALEKTNSKYSIAIREDENTPGLPSVTNALLIYDGNPPGTYIEPGDYWDTEESSDALTRTMAVAKTGYFNFSMWSWCGQQSDNEVADVNRYLNNLDYLEKQYPNMRFIYMTGHTDGGTTELKRNNNMVRDYAKKNNKVLFDFADIESYDPDGNYYPDTTDECEWCKTWCSKHPEDCKDLTNDCQHSHPYNCKLKAKAFWWMMAKLAGWNGTVSGVQGPVSSQNVTVQLPPNVSANITTAPNITVNKTPEANISANVTQPGVKKEAEADCLVLPAIAMVLLLFVIRIRN